MYNIIDRPYSVSFNNGLYYSKRKLFDEPPIQYDQTNTAGYYGFIQSPSFHGIEQSNHILNTHNFNFQKQQQQYTKSKYNDNRQQQQHQHAKPTEQRSLASPDSGRNSHKQRFSPNSQRLVLVEDMSPRTKLKRQNDHHNTSNDNQLVNNKGNKSQADQHHQQQQVNNNLKLNRKFPTFNNSSMLNSLADYNLNSLDDKMFNLTIDYSRNDIRNMSLDSLTNVRVKMANKSIPLKDEFAAYRLNEVDIKADMAEQQKIVVATQMPMSNSDHSFIFSKNKFSTLSSYNCAKLDTSKKTEEPKAAQEGQTSAAPAPKKNRHHHHRARRNKRNQNKNNLPSSGAVDLKKSPSSLVETEQENQDSLSAFDFSNTDEFWEDDIIINSELIEPDKFLADDVSAIETCTSLLAPIKFVSLSCDGINGLLNSSSCGEADKFDLKESIIKDKLYEDILDFKDNLTIN